MWGGYRRKKCIQILPPRKLKRPVHAKKHKKDRRDSTPVDTLAFQPKIKISTLYKPIRRINPQYLSWRLQQFCKMSSEYTLSLIEFDSQRLDLELQYECLFLSPLMSCKSLPPIGDYMFPQNPQAQDQCFENDEDSMDNSTSYGETKRESSDAQSHKYGSAKKTKKISKKYSLPDTSDSDSESRTQTKKKKAGKAKNAKNGKNPQYPTKNFLPNFKTPHLDFLRQFLQVDIMQCEFIRYLHEKDGISLKDYEHLYNMPEFTQAFEAMFECRYLYRELMLSRSGLKAKRIHQRKLYVFEDAFRNKNFPRINY